VNTLRSGGVKPLQITHGILPNSVALDSTRKSNEGKCRASDRNPTPVVTPVVNLTHARMHTHTHTHTKSKH
jgi:hypothetical protein